MPPRASFLIDVEQWRADEALKAHPRLKGSWVDVQCLLVTQTEPWIYRGPLKELADEAGCPLPHVEQLRDLGYLEGAEAGVMCNGLIHKSYWSKQRGEPPAVLIPPQRGPLWYAPKRVRDMHVRERKAAAGKHTGTANVFRLKKRRAKSTAHEHELEAPKHMLEGSGVAHKHMLVRGTPAGTIENAGLSQVSEARALMRARSADDTAPSPPLQPLPLPPQTPGSSIPASGGAPPLPGLEIAPGGGRVRLSRPASAVEAAQVDRVLAWWATAWSQKYDRPAAREDHAVVLALLRRKEARGNVEALQTCLKFYLDHVQFDGHPLYPRMALRKLTDEQVEIRKAFVEWWVATWPRFHDGNAYERNDPRDFQAAVRYLGREQIKWNADWARAVALHYLAINEIYNLHDHPLWKLAQGANHYARVTRQRQKEGTGHVIGIRRPAGERGEFPDSGRAVPRFGQAAG